MAIGQEVSVTLLQMMLAYATVANGGVLVTPQICEKIVTPEGSVIEQAKDKPVRRVLSQETAHRLSIMLRCVVDSGTGKNAAIASVAIAGKTGTAQKLDSGVYSKTRSWTSFMGFLPVDRPCLLCGIVIDEPANNLMGGTAAAPAFKKIITQVISHPSLEFAEKILNNRSIALAKMMPKTEPAVVAAPAPIQTVASAATQANDARTVPNCIGKDARDAINIVNLHGLVPHVIGAGTVRRQCPPAGSLTTTAESCTLICSFGG
jgi:cell division protein FtsI (penicillin-binding protein 3)